MFICLISVSVHQKHNTSPHRVVPLQTDQLLKAVQRQTEDSPRHQLVPCTKQNEMQETQATDQTD